MNIFKARTRKPSIQPSAVDSTPVVLQPQAQARLRLPSDTPVSRISHVFSIPPEPGMQGILITDGVQMTIEYLREIPYTGEPPTLSPAIVQPVPKFRVGNQLPLFVNKRHFLALIKAVEPHTHILSEDVPQITQIFDFPTMACDSTPFLDIPLSKPSTCPQNELGLLAIPEVPPTRTAIYPPPSIVSLEQQSPMASTRTRAKTLSTAALNISQTDQEAFQRVQDRFLATGPSITHIKITPSTKEAHEFPSSNSLRRPSDAVSLSPPLLRDTPPTAPISPSPAPQQQQRTWLGRARTASDLDEQRPTQPRQRRYLRPSGSSNTVAVPSTVTPAPRRRLYSDAGPMQPRSNGPLARSGTVQAQGRAQSQAQGPSHQSQWTRRKPAPRVSQVPEADQPGSKGSRFFKFGTAKAKIPFLSNGARFPDFKGVGIVQTATTTTDELLQGAMIDPTVPYSNNAPSIPVPSGLVLGGSGPGGERGVSWISQWDLGQPVQVPSQGGRTELIFDPLSAQEQKLRERKHSHPASAGSSPGESQAPRRNGFVPMLVNPYDGSAVQLMRAPHTSPGLSMVSSLPNQSRAESRRNSSRKELPPIPISGPLLYSPESLFRSQIKEEKANEKECRRGQSAEKSLGDALELTPPATPTFSIVGGDLTQQPNPTESPAPGAAGSTSLSAITPNTRLTTFQVARMVKGKERTTYDAKPTPLEQMRTRPPYGSIFSVTTQTSHDVVRPPASEPQPMVLTESTSTASVGGSRQVYETAPSSVDEVSIDILSNQIMGTNDTQLAQVTNTGRAWIAATAEGEMAG